MHSGRSGGLFWGIVLHRKVTLRPRLLPTPSSTCSYAVPMQRRVAAIFGDQTWLICPSKTQYFNLYALGSASVAAQLSAAMIGNSPDVLDQDCSVER